MLNILEGKLYLSKKASFAPLAQTADMPDTLATRLKRLRQDAELTQAQLAKMTGVSQVAISQIERGLTSGRGRTVALAAALRVNPTWLEAGKGPRDPPAWEELLDVSQLPTDVQSAIRRLVQALAAGEVSTARFRAALALILDDLDS